MKKYALSVLTVLFTLGASAALDCKDGESNIGTCGPLGPRKLTVSYEPQDGAVAFFCKPLPGESPLDRRRCVLRSPEEVQDLLQKVAACADNTNFAERGCEIQLGTEPQAQGRDI